ncbi:MAG: helix-turn-helix domain-containing protein [Faecousia sp.]
MFAETLRQLRISRHMSQKQFAKALFISPSAVSQYETGHTMPSRENLERIAKFFDVSTDYLLGSSPIAELEAKLNQDYCNGVRVSEFVSKCMSITGKHRETLLDVVNALTLSCELNKK